MGRNSGGGGGCFIWGIVIIGNLLLFSGSLFGDLSDSWIAWLLAIIAVVIDVIFVESLISSASKNREQRSYQQEANTRSMHTPLPPQRAVQQRATTEPTDNSKLGALKAKYSVPAVPTIPTAIDPLQKDMESYQAPGVLRTVNRVINIRRSITKQLEEQRREIADVLSCPGCTSDKEKLKYLKSREEELTQKKKDYLESLAKVSSKKVAFIPKDNQTFSQLRVLFSEVSNSQKIVGDAGVAYQECVKLNSSLPGDLFETKQKPIELNFGAYRFFMLPDVILAYNKAGEFVTAFEPMAIIIRIDEKQQDVYCSNMGGRGWTHIDNVIASDSTLISQGYVRSGWLHEKKSGGPDLRYSFANNPRYDSRTDTYSYSEISIQIGHYNAIYSASKGSLASKAKPIIRKYCSLSHGLNVVPSLLRLFETTAKGKNEATNLYNEYVRICKDIICKEA